MPRKRDALHSLSLRLVARAIRKRVEDAHRTAGGGGASPRQHAPGPHRPRLADVEQRSA